MVDHVPSPIVKPILAEHPSTPHISSETPKESAKVTASQTELKLFDATTFPSVAFEIV